MHCPPLIGRRMLMLSALGLMVAGRARAAMPSPKDSPILTVTGAITERNFGDAAVFDREMLAALPQQTFRTSTIWTDGVHSFTGPALAAILDAVGARGTRIRAIAINDYSVEFPVADVTPRVPMVAHLMDGKPMSVRDKGPLWIIYPYDEDPRWQSELVYSRSIWQLDRLEILP